MTKTSEARATPKTPFLTYDTRRMNEDIPIQGVIAAYAGINVSGKSKNIHCPSPNHRDKKPSAHIYGNNCKCFSCGGNFSPISLAKEYFPELSFPDLCRKLLDDFGKDVYQYSNLAEIEAIKNAHAHHKFYDYFPVTEDDLNLIGLHNPTGNEEYFYSVRATEYYMFFNGEIPEGVQTYDKNGTELIMELTSGEARDMGIPTRSNAEHEYIESSPTIQQLWKDDKDGIEAMIVGKCYETITAINQQIESTEADIANYRNTHTTNQIKEADKLRSGYVKILCSGGNVRLSETQKQKIDDLYAFENNKIMLPALNDRLHIAESVLDKVAAHRKEREQAWKSQKHAKTAVSRE